MNSNKCILVWASDIVGKRKNIYCKHNGINATVWTIFFQKIWGNKKCHAHKQTMMRLFEFFTFYYSFLLLTVFFLKDAVHQRAFCSYIVIFYRGKYCTTLFFSSQNIWRNIIYTHLFLILWLLISNDNSWSMCPLLGRTYLLNINRGWLWQIYNLVLQ